MSKKHPDDMDYREALPCEWCGVTVEGFNIATGYVGCPNCEKEHPTRAIMRLEGFTIESRAGVQPNVQISWAKVKLMAGPEQIASGEVATILRLIEEKGYTVDGVNYSSYQKRREERRNGK